METAASFEARFAPWSYPTIIRSPLRASVLPGNNDDILPKIRKPALITHGASDAIVKPSAASQQKASMTHAQVQMLEKVGHAAFWDDAAAFNRRQREFCESLR